MHARHDKLSPGQIPFWLGFFVAQGGHALQPIDCARALGLNTNASCGVLAGRRKLSPGHRQAGRGFSLRCDFGRSLPSWGVNYNSVMERVVVSILALVAAATTAISLGIIANRALAIPPTEIRLNALSGAGVMFLVLVCASVRRR